MLTDSSGNSVNYYSAVLKKDGFQLARNYEYELNMFNESDNPAAIKVNLNVNSERINTELRIANESNDIPVSEMMLKYWYLQAGDDIRQRFKVWLSDK